MKTIPHPLFLTALMAVIAAAALAVVSQDLAAAPLISPVPADGQNSEAARFQVLRAPTKMKIDGVLDETAWAEAAAIPLPYEWLPGDNIPAPVRTECLVTYDLHNLYVGFRCFDPDPRKIRAHLMDRDDSDTLILDDHISIMVDAFNDERRGFQFRVNPLGVQADANFSELERYEDFSWDAIWNAAGMITDWGYAIEIAIPLDQLRFRKSDGPQTWGFSADRSWPRDVRHRITSHVRSRSVDCVMCQFNKLTGFEGIAPGRSLEFDPTFTASRTDAMKPEEYPAGSLVKGDGQYDPGLTVKWGVTPNLILNGTVNPDFSQVEADAAQLEINRRYALFYPEKRPFFLEGADFFLTPIQAVFTRTVADPTWGAKMTAKMGRTAVGIFSAEDRLTNLIIPFNQYSFTDSLDQNATGGVFRVRQDVGRGSTLGVLYTGRAGRDYFNHVGGADGFLRLSQTSSLTFQYLHSETDYPDGLAASYSQQPGRFGGNAFNVAFRHFSRNWIVNAIYEDLSPGFRADYGFIPRVDTRTATGLLLRQIWGKPGGWFNRLLLGFLGRGIFDHNGTATDKALTAQVVYAGPLETQATLNAHFMRTLYEGRDFDTVDGELEFHIRPFSGSEFGLQAMAGSWVDYENVRPANLLSVGPRGAVTLGRHLNVILGHSYERLYLGGSTIYTANLSQAKLVWNFNVRAFARAIVQYRDTKRNEPMYTAPVDPRTQGVFTQFLFSYKLNPRTVLFVGYSDNSLGGVFLELERVDITRTDRTFFLKISYAWQL